MYIPCKLARLSIVSASDFREKISVRWAKCSRRYRLIIEKYFFRALPALYSDGFLEYTEPEFLVSNKWDLSC